MKNFEKFVVDTIVENQYTGENFGSIGLPKSVTEEIIDGVTEEELRNIYLNCGVVTIPMKSLVFFAANLTVSGAMDSEFTKEASEVLVK